MDSIDKNLCNGFGLSLCKKRPVYLKIYDFDLGVPSKFRLVYGKLFVACVLKTKKKVPLKTVPKNLTYFISIRQIGLGPHAKFGKNRPSNKGVIAENVKVFFLCETNYRKGDLLNPECIKIRRSTLLQNKLGFLTLNSEFHDCSSMVTSVVVMTWLASSGPARFLTHCCQICQFEPCFVSTLCCQF